MSAETARAAVELMFDCLAEELTVEFQGGEPLLAFDNIKLITELISQRNIGERHRITLTITSTLHHANDEVLAFLRDHDFHISTSFDGPASLHNANRPTPGRDAYERTIEGITRARETLGFDRVAALVTLTRRSLEQPEAIVDEYVRLGFKGIFLRPIAPFGFAARASKLGFRSTDFLQFYDRALCHILALNRKGIQLAETTRNDPALEHPNAIPNLLRRSAVACRRWVRHPGLQL
jgi:sulfatase maturation enzyme AslB (radical SAM superfamily)